jgi:hypothetical protein
MPIISHFFGIIIRMFYDKHNPPHLHAECQGNKALFDFKGNIIKGDLRSGQRRSLSENGLTFMIVILKKIGGWQGKERK